MSDEKDDKQQQSDNDQSNKGSGDDDVIPAAETPTSAALLTALEHGREYDEAVGAGAGRTGSAVFHMQRLTALALIPLAVWFVVSIVHMIATTVSHAAAAQWLAWPVNAALVGLFIVIGLRHAVIGIQIVLEDYVDTPWLHRICLRSVQALALLVGLAAVMALVHVALQ